MVDVSCSACDYSGRLADDFTDAELICPKCKLELILMARSVPPWRAAARDREEPILAEIVRPPHPGFWWAVLWCVGMLVVTQALPGFLALILFIVSVGGLRPEELMNPRALMGSPEYAQAMLPAMVVSQALSITLAWLAIRLVVGKEWPRILALRRPSWPHLALTLMGLPGVLGVAMLIDVFAKQLPSIVDIEQMMGMFGQWPWPLGVLVIGLGPGIGEELWFRGFFGRGIVGRHGVVWGVLLTSILFGVVHMEPRQAVPTIVIGILLHLSYLASRSLLVPMIVHIANNALSILAMHSPALKALNMPAEQVPWHVYGAAILLVAAVGWAFFKSRTRLVDFPDSESPAWLPAFAGVEFPPSGTATRVKYPGPGLIGWMLAIGGFVLFVVAAKPVFFPGS